MKERFCRCWKKWPLPNPSPKREGLNHCITNHSPFSPGLVFIHIFLFKANALIMCKLHIVIGNIFIVLHVLLIVSQYVLYFCLFCGILLIPITINDSRTGKMIINPERILTKAPQIVVRYE
jgi:hypothetical protein